MMKAQFMYDLREKYGFCSGTDLHEFFDQEVGEMSPKGAVKINHVNARNFIASCIDAIKKNNNGNDCGTEAAFLEAAKVSNW